MHWFELCVHGAGCPQQGLWVASEPLLTRTGEILGGAEPISQLLAVHLHLRLSSGFMINNQG